MGIFPQINNTLMSKKKNSANFLSPIQDFFPNALNYLEQVSYKLNRKPYRINRRFSPSTY